MKALGSLVIRGEGKVLGSENIRQSCSAKHNFAEYIRTGFWRCITAQIITSPEKGWVMNIQERTCPGSCSQGKLDLVPSSFGTSGWLFLNWNVLWLHAIRQHDVALRKALHCPTPTPLHLHNTSNTSHCQ